MIDVLGPENADGVLHRKKIAVVQRSFEPGMTVLPCCPATRCVAASQLFLWRKQYREGSLTAAAGEQVVPASELCCCHEEAIKNSSARSAKRWKMNSLKPLNMGVQKWIAHALIARDGGVSLVSRCLLACAVARHSQTNR